MTVRAAADILFEKVYPDWLQGIFDYIVFDYVEF